MAKNVLIFLPNSFSSSQLGFVQGFHTKHNNSDAYFITDTQARSNITSKDSVGYIGKYLTNPEIFGRNLLFIEQHTGKIQIEHGEDRKNVHYVEIFYDMNEFQSCGNAIDDRENYGIHVNNLIQSLQKSKTKKEVKLCNFPTSKTSNKLDKTRSVIKNCATLTHLESTFISFKWFFSTIMQFSLVHFNMCAVKLIDIILGLLFIYFGLKYQSIVVTNLSCLSQNFVTVLRDLLVYLMGAPIGLKLNYTFNRSLGYFFFYHINLWRVFLEGMKPILRDYFTLLLLPGVFGMSFQISMICDMLSIATFHVYCIYVYAARLFYLQLKGLISLSRLFIGRKSNPLRDRVDSCEYSSNQLFIGTLGFTILLFLLPTTTMYYAVFAVFRIAILCAYTVLMKVKAIVRNIPLFVVILWILKSPHLPGTPDIRWVQTTNEKTHIQLRLLPLPLSECCRKLSKRIESNSKSNENSSGGIISKLFTGKII